MGTAATTTTVGYSVRPEYRYPREGKQPEITGYVASNIVRVTTSQLDRVGEVIDSAVNAGANGIERIRFTLENDQAARSLALRKAATSARAEAEALAAALGLRLVRVLAVEEHAPPVRPLHEPFRAGLAAESATIPVEPGTIDIHATVFLTMEVAER